MCCGCVLIVQTQLSSLLRVLSNDPWHNYVGLSLSLVTWASASIVWPTVAVTWPRTANHQRSAVMWSAETANKQAETSIMWSATASQRRRPTVVKSHVRQLSVLNCQMICDVLLWWQLAEIRGVRERMEMLAIWWKSREENMSIVENWLSFMTWFC